MIPDMERTRDMASAREYTKEQGSTFAAHGKGYNRARSLAFGGSTSLSVRWCFYCAIDAPCIKGCVVLYTRKSGTP